MGTKLRRRFCGYCIINNLEPWVMKVLKISSFIKVVGKLCECRHGAPMSPVFPSSRMIRTLLLKPKSTKKIWLILCHQARMWSLIYSVISDNTGVSSKKTFCLFVTPPRLLSTSCCCLFWWYHHLVVCGEYVWWCAERVVWDYRDVTQRSILRGRGSDQERLSACSVQAVFEFVFKLE